MIYVRRIYAATLARQGKYKESLSIFEKLYDEVESDSPLKPVFKEEISKLKKAIEKTSI